MRDLVVSLVVIGFIARIPDAALAQATYPECQIWLEGLQATELSECSSNGLRFYDCDTITTADFLKTCQNRACTASVAAIKAKNPSECRVESEVDTKTCLLYAQVLNPLASICNSLTVPSAAPSPTTTSPTTTPKPPAATPAPKKTTRSPSSPSTTAPVADDTGSDTQETTAPSPGTTKQTRSPSKSTTAPSFSSSKAGSSDTSEAPENTQPTVPISSSSSSSSSSSTSSPSASSSTSASSGNEQANTTSPAPTAAQRETDSPSSQINQEAARSNSSFASSWKLWTVIGAVLFAAIAAAAVWRKRRARALKADGSEHTATTVGGSSAYSTLADAEAISHKQKEIPPSLRNELEALETWRIDASAIVDVSLVGKGGQGAVFLVKLNSTKLLVSKRLVRDQVSAPRLHTLINEIRLNASLHHASIVSFIGVAWTSPYDLQALFEYMAKGDLRSFLDKFTPDLEASWDAIKVQIALSVAEALVYVHSFNPPIVHRDVKARNVMLNDDLRAKLTDFGVAREQSEEGTMTTGIGTNRWLAPEVIRGGGKYNEQCDIYSFGVLLTELDTHRVPYADVVGVSEIVLLHQVSKGELRPTYNAVGDEPLRALIERCLAHEPASRLSAMEVSYALRQISKSRGKM